jgi:hypothetical protein
MKERTILLGDARDEFGSNAVATTSVRQDLDGVVRVFPQTGQDSLLGRCVLLNRRIFDVLCLVICDS